MRTATLLPLLLASLAFAGENLLPNPGFEETDADGPAAWRPTTWQGEGDFRHERAGRNGSHCLVISSERGGDLSWFTEVEVEPRSVYRLTGWVRTEGLEPTSGVGALLNVHTLAGARSDVVTGDAGWTHVESTIRTGDRDSILVNCLFGGWGFAVGTAYFDDLSLEKIVLEDTPIAVTIDADKTGHPISPYVYGQFIEHLGRCIYGGLWAEMLEDRKFFFPVTPDFAPWRGPEGPTADPNDPFPTLVASPWRIVGEPDAVSMSGDEPYARRKVVRVEPRNGEGGEGGGVEQPGLSLVEGRDYVGRIVARNLQGPLSSRGIAATITLAWGDGPDERESARVEVIPAFTKHSFRFTASASTADATLSITSEEPFELAAVSLMPADNILGFRADTLEVLEQLDSPLYRWPGGNFVSGYDWRDGIGDPDERPTYRNPAWTGIETNDVGLHEFLALCRRINTEPLVVVNTGFGDPYSAALEVEYCNTTDTPMARLRAANGHPKPFGVTWWGIGNEMYGGWQLGHMNLNHYTQKHNRTVDRMRRVDPSIKTVAVGATGQWSRTMLERCAGHMDLLSEHFYCQERTDVPEHVRQITEAVRNKAEAHRRYQRQIPGAEDIRIALDEWNYWYGPHLYGELGTAYSLKDALGIAAGLHEMFRHADVFEMANYAQTVNVIGAIKTTDTQAFFDTTGEVLRLYRREFGTVPVGVTGNHHLFEIDVAAAWTNGREIEERLAIGIVNPSPEERVIELDVQGLRPRGATVFCMSGPDPRATNSPDEPGRVAVTRLDRIEFKSLVTVPGYSVTVLQTTGQTPRR
jgi:alpha-N-arabinofuranosidase